MNRAGPVPHDHDRSSAVDAMQTPLGAESPPQAARADAQVPFGARLVDAALRPHVIAAVLALVVALVLLLASPTRPTVDADHVSVTPPTASATTADVRLVLVDDAGLEWSRVTQVSLPEGHSARMAAVVDALRRTSIEEGLWPDALPTPRVFVETFDRRRVAVIDVAIPQAVGVSVAREEALLRALVATVEANGADAVRFLRDGRPTATFLGHVAVPSSL